jgi:mRNA interferase HigB
MTSRGWPARIRDFYEQYPGAKANLQSWIQVVKPAEWKNFPDLRRTFPQADQAMVASGRPVVVFNVSGNRYRLICAVHFDKQRVFVLKFMTHAEYSKDRWKHLL